MAALSLEWLALHAHPCSCSTSEYSLTGSAGLYCFVRTRSAVPAQALHLSPSKKIIPNTTKSKYPKIITNYNSHYLSLLSMQPGVLARLRSGLPASSWPAMPTAERSTSIPALMHADAASSTYALHSSYIQCNVSGPRCKSCQIFTSPRLCCSSLEHVWNM